MLWRYCLIFLKYTFVCIRRFHTNRRISPCPCTIVDPFLQFPYSIYRNIGNSQVGDILLGLRQWHMFTKLYRMKSETKRLKMDVPFSTLIFLKLVSHRQKSICISNTKPLGLYSKSSLEQYCSSIPAYVCVYVFSAGSFQKAYLEPIRPYQINSIAGRVDQYLKTWYWFDQNNQYLKMIPLGFS